MNHLLLVAFAVTLGALPSKASDPFSKAADEVNTRTVKLFGSGGFRGVANYGTGVLVSPDGHILTLASQMLDTSELIVHLYDGRRMKATVVATEPELDVALLKVKIEGKKHSYVFEYTLPEKP